jgi:lysine-specific permease
VIATYIGIPLFLAVWLGYRLVKKTRFIRYAEMRFPEVQKR